MSDVSASGAVRSREGGQRLRFPVKKRDVMRHLPEGTIGVEVQDVRVDDGECYADDGITRSEWSAVGGRVRVKAWGGGDVQGVKVRVDAGVDVEGRAKSRVGEFPELDIFEGDEMDAEVKSELSGSACVEVRVCGECACTGNTTC